MRSRTGGWAVCLVALATLVSPAAAGDWLEAMQAMAVQDIKPFVVIEASTTTVTNYFTNTVSNTVEEITVTTVTRGHGQGVVISPAGYVLSAGHVTYLKEDLNAFADHVRVSFRSAKALDRLPSGVVHRHTTTFNDMEGRPFYESFYDVDLMMGNGSRYIDKRDLCVLRIDAEGGRFPSLDFYSHKRPPVKIGDVFHLCHYDFPYDRADPHFMINPITVTGVVNTPSGLQYLAEGYYRVGSSGGAILKDGKLIGIQSSGYTVNASTLGEVPIGVLSFHAVWEDQVAEFLASARPVPAGRTPPPQPETE